MEPVKSQESEESTGAIGLTESITSDNQHSKGNGWKTTDSTESTVPAKSTESQ
jgi:hypothetical protein